MLSNIKSVKLRNIFIVAEFASSERTLSSLRGASNTKIVREREKQKKKKVKNNPKSTQR